MSSDDIEARVKQLLADLGGDRDTVAGRLAALGIRGRPEDGQACPVFNYLEANDVPVKWVDFANVDGDDWWESPPEPVAEFITAFDDGAYPDLIQAVQPWPR